MVHNLRFRSIQSWYYKRSSTGYAMITDNNPTLSGESIQIYKFQRDERYSVAFLPWTGDSE